MGVGTAKPEAPLHVAGETRLDGTATVRDGLRIGDAQEILFADGGQIRSADDNHRILFRRKENKLELREFGDIVLSPGATSGAETAKVVVKSNGNVGIGVAEPAAPLHVRSHMAVGPLSQGEAEGRLEVSGKTAEIAFMRRSLTAWAAKPLAGDRFLWYNPDGTARLWTEEKGDLLSVTAAGAVGIGTSDPQGKLNIVHKAEDANGSAVIVGPTNGANLRLGYHADYAWIQSHGSKPLMINPVGNAVTIRQEDWQPVKFQDGWTDYGARSQPRRLLQGQPGDRAPARAREGRGPGVREDDLHPSSRLPSRVPAAVRQRAPRSGVRPRGRGDQRPGDSHLGDVQLDVPRRAHLPGGLMPLVEGRALGLDPPPRERSLELTFGEAAGEESGAPEAVESIAALTAGQEFAAKAPRTPRPPPNVSSPSCRTGSAPG